MAKCLAGVLIVGIVPEALAVEAALPQTPQQTQAADVLRRWRNGVAVEPASGRQDRHTIHAYFNT